MSRYVPPFHKMGQYYPKDVETEKWIIENFEITEEDARWQKMRGMFSGHATEWYDFKADKYVRLMNKKARFDGPMMSDTPMEMRTNMHLVRAAHGNVLIAGLGIGMLIPPLLEKDTVTKITIVEIEEDVINLVDVPHRFRNLPFPHRVEVIHADILEWSPPKGELYNCIYFDIWQDISDDNHASMKKLHLRFKNRLDRSDPLCFMDSWRKEDVYKLAAEARKWGY